MTLFDIDTQIRQFLDRLYTSVDEDGTIPEADFEALAELKAERDVKVESIALYIKELEVEAQALKDEADKLSKRATVAANKADRLREYLRSSLYEENKDRLETSKDKTVFESVKCKISFKKSVSVSVPDVAKIPKKYRSVSIKETPDKKAIRAAIEAGQKVRGAELVTKQNIQIK